MLVSRRYERASLIVTSNKPFSGLGRDLRRRRHRRRDDRPPRSPRRDPRPQRRQLPPQRPRPRPSAGRKLTPPARRAADAAPPRPTASAPQHRRPLPGGPLSTAPPGGSFSTGATGSFSSGLDTRPSQFPRPNSPTARSHVDIAHAASSPQRCVAPKPLVGCNHQTPVRDVTKNNASGCWKTRSGGSRTRVAGPGRVSHGPVLAVADRWFADHPARSSGAECGARPLQVRVESRRLTANWASLGTV